MSDEEELEREAKGRAHMQGVGEEVVVDMTADMRELGILPEVG